MDIDNVQTKTNLQYAPEILNEDEVRNRRDQDVIDLDSKHGKETPNDEHDAESDKKNDNRRSWVWDHFTFVKGETQVPCPYCKKVLAVGTKRNGTSTLIQHLKNVCKKSPVYKKVNLKNQATFAFIVDIYILCLLVRLRVIELSALDFQIVGRYSNKWYQSLVRGSWKSRIDIEGSNEATWYRQLGFLKLGLSCRVEEEDILGTEFDIEKFDGKNNFGLWQVRMKALLEQQGLAIGGIYTFQMHPDKSQSEHIDEFYKLVGDLAAIDTAISDEDQALLLLTSFLSSYDNFVDTLLYGRDTLKLEDLLTTLNSKEHQKMTEAKGDGGEALCVRGRSGQIDIEQGKDIAYNHKKSQGFVRNEDQVFGSGADEYDNVDVMMVMSVDKLDNILLGDGRECRVRRTGSDQEAIEGKEAVRRISDWVEDQDGIKQGMLEPIKVKCIFLGYRKPIVGNKALEVWVQCRCCKELSLRWKRKRIIHLRWNLMGMFCHVASSQEVQTQDLIYYHFARDREQHSTHELLSYREDNNEAGFAVAEVEKIYAHESLTFNNTVACEVISKWKTGLKDDMDARSDVYVLSNGCKKCSADNDVYYWEYTPGMFIHLFLYIDDMVFLAVARLRSRLSRVCLIK
ncbi:zinc finger, CCHC-type containing protein [Tanacetum coccineum]